MSHLNVPESCAYDPQAPWNVAGGNYGTCRGCYEQLPVKALTEYKDGKYFCADCMPTCGFKYSADKEPCESHAIVDGYDHCARCVVINLSDERLSDLKAPEDWMGAEYFDNLRREIAEMERLRDGKAA